MPLYEYKCNKCNECFEKLVSFGKEKEISCPTCEGTNVERIMSKVAFASKDAGGTITKSSLSSCSSCSSTHCSSCH